MLPDITPALVGETPVAVLFPTLHFPEAPKPDVPMEFTMQEMETAWDIERSTSEGMRADLSYQEIRAGHPDARSFDRRLHEVHHLASELGSVAATRIMQRIKQTQPFGELSGQFAKFHIFAGDPESMAHGTMQQAHHLIKQENNLSSSAFLRTMDSMERYIYQDILTRRAEAMHDSPDTNMFAAIVLFDRQIRNEDVTMVYAPISDEEYDQAIVKFYNPKTQSNPLQTQAYACYASVLARDGRGTAGVIMSSWKDVHAAWLNVARVRRKITPSDVLVRVGTAIRGIPDEAHAPEDIHKIKSVEHALVPFMDNSAPLRKTLSQFPKLRADWVVFNELMMKLYVDTSVDVQKIEDELNEASIRATGTISETDAPLASAL